MLSNYLNRKKRVIKHILFLNKHKRTLKMNSIFLFEVKEIEIYALGETKKEKI